MTTIILTIIGILLAAAAALMVIFYGGDAFNSGTVGAQANQIQNAGTNVVSAAQMFRAETGQRPTGLAQLTTAAPGNPIGGAFLDEEPVLPGGVGAATLTTTGTLTLYQVATVPAAICARINANLRVGTAPAAVPTTNTGVKMACAQTAPTAVGTFFARA